mmetsp:Transcript_8571/g.11949  ORF Transcript_8571/g.11949 Transcript_8571/m.11949 type:complete len:229 (-) Transcript_8571:20-706(-)
MQETSDDDDKAWLVDYIADVLRAPTWTEGIEAFVNEKCVLFDLLDPDENKLEYTDIHNDYKDVVETLLAVHLLDVNATPEECALALEIELAKREGEDKRDMHVALSQLISASDFVHFKAMMMNRFRDQQLELEAVYAAADVAAAQPPVESQDALAALPAPPSSPSPVQVQTKPAITAKELLPVPAGGSRADRINAILQKASSAKPDEKERAARLRVAMTETAGKLYQK